MERKKFIAIFMDLFSFFSKLSSSSEWSAGDKRNLR